MNKRKNRGGPVRTQRQRSIAPEGVYNNAPFMHAATSHVGNIARIKTASGAVWEGVFKTFSTNFDVVLEVAVKVANPDSSDAHLIPDSCVDKLIFKANDIASMVFNDVDLDYPVRDTFQTDTAISARLNGSKSEEKELEPWDAGQVNGTDDIGLDLDAANGWDANDMFRKNEQEYGVQSTFDHSLRGYTVPLQTSNSPDYREAQAKADQIANEIENQPLTKARLELENGDEESVFAAVTRPNQQESSNGKYIPPAKRKNQNNGKLVRSTPPPSSGSSSQNSPSPKETRPPVSYPPHGGHQNSVHNIPSPHTPPQPAPQGPPQIQHGPPHMHNTGPPQVPPQMQALPSQQHPQNMPLPHGGNRPNSHTPPHQFQGPPRQGPPQGHHKPQINGEAKSGPQQRQQRHQYQQQQERVGQQQQYQDMKQQQDSPPIHAPPQPPRNQPPPPQPRHEPPLHPPPQEALKDLHSFAQEFKLAPLPAQPQIQGPQQPPMQPPPPQMQAPQPQMQGPQPQIQGPPESPQMGPPGMPNMGNNSANMVDQGMGGGQGPMGPPQGLMGPQKQPSPAQSPANSEADKMQSTVQKSKLNPNAKEFVLNPTAKPFQPRYVKSPSTPSASRPHTPQTPSHSPYIPQSVSGPGGPPMQVMMPMYHIGLSQPQYQPPPQQGNRIKRIPISQMRTDVASQMQAAAVTGQPLLAPAPIQQFIYNPAAAAAAASAHGMNPSAAYQPAAVAAMHAAATLRMYAHDAAAAAGQPQIQYLPPPQPSGTPSPAQQQYTQAGVQQPQGPPQQYQRFSFSPVQAAPPPQGPPQIPMAFCIPTQAHMLQNMPAAYLQQGPPPPPPQHMQVLVQHQHPQQGGNHHGPNP